MEKRLKAISEAEVVVVGAGASGIPAAIAAARAGATVILLEEDPVIGGAPSDYFVDMFCGGPLSGIMLEMKELLDRKYALAPQSAFYLPSGFQGAFWDLIRRERRIRVITGARVVETIRRGGSRVTGVRVRTQVGQAADIRGKVIIDATGNGTVAILAGCPARYGRDARRDFGEPHAPPVRDDLVQQCTWMYLSHQLPGHKPFDMTRLEHCRLGVLPANVKRYFHHHPDAVLRNYPGLFLHWGCAVRCADTRDRVALGRAHQEALQLMERDHALLREAGFAIYLAPHIGVRETSRVVGRQVITENDLASGKLPEDTVAVGNYEIDIWGESAKTHARLERLPGYGIPYRALLPKGMDGLLLAGKSISGTHIAMSAYRVMPIVAGIGQAAGVAAALCARQGCLPAQIDPAQVRSVLRREKQRLQLEFPQARISN